MALALSVQILHVVDDNARMLPLRLSDASSRWLHASMAAVLWALAAGSTVLWGLHFPKVEDARGNAPSVTPAAPTPQATAAVVRALGHTQVAVATPEAGRRFQLLGVIAADSGQGSALLAVDGQPAQAFVQGQTVAEGWRLQSVGRETVRLSAGQGAAELELSLPAQGSRSGR